MFTIICLYKNPSHIINKYIELAKNLLKGKINIPLSEINKIDLNWFKNDKNKFHGLYIFLNFMHNEDSLALVEEINEKLSQSWDKKIFSEINFLSNEEKLLIFSIFIFKAFNKTSLSSRSKNLNFVDSDKCLNALLEYYQNMHVWYLHSLSKDIHFLKKLFFKNICILVELNVIFEQLVLKDKKTFKEWSLKRKTFYLSSDEHMNISLKPFQVVVFEDKKFLVGTFFNQVYKIFNENLRSNEVFNLKDLSYLDKITNSGFYLNNKDLNDVINVIEDKENLKLKDVEKLVNSINEEILLNSEKITTIKEDAKKKHLSLALTLVEEKFNSLKVKNSEEFLLKIFNTFCKNFLKKMDITLEEDMDFASILEPHFKKYFQSKPSKYIIKFEKIKGFSYLFENEESFLNEEDDPMKVYDLELSQNLSSYESDDEKQKKYVNDDDTKENKSYDDFLKNESNFSFQELISILKIDEIKKIIKKVFKKKHKVENYSKVLFESFEKTSNDSNNFAVLSTNEKKVIQVLSLKFSDSDQWKKYYSDVSNKTAPIVDMNKKAYSRLSKLTLNYYLFALKNLEIKDDEQLFFPFFFDFRGRFYYYSAVSPTTLKYCRYIYNYGFFNPCDFEKTSLTDEIQKYKFYIDKIKAYYQINKSSNFIDEAIFWTLISIGKIKLDKEKIKLSVEDILATSISLIFFTHIELNDIIDIIEYKHYTKILKSLNDEKILKRGLLKDATASFIQNLIRLMGYKNQISLEYANLNSLTHWFDTYSFILYEWLKQERKDGEVNEMILRLFVRKTIKKAVMTNPYSAKYLTAFNYFKEAVKDVFDVDVLLGGEEEKVFQRFYKFISEEVENRFFLKNNSMRMVEHIEKILTKSNCEIIIETHDSKSNFIYYKFKSKTYDIVWKVTARNTKKRSTKKYKIIDHENIDFKKIASSLRANWIHYIDALLVRDINRNFTKTYISIHDCFIVDPFSVSKFIIIANKESNRKIFESFKWNLNNEFNFFSIFIFI